MSGLEQQSALIWGLGLHQGAVDAVISLGHIGGISEESRLACAGWSSALIMAVVSLEKFNSVPWRWLWQDKGVLVAQKKGESALFLAQAQKAAQPVTEARRLMQQEGPGHGWQPQKADLEVLRRAHIWEQVHEWDEAQVAGLFWLMAQLRQKVDRPVEFWAFAE